MSSPKNEYVKPQQNGQEQLLHWIIGINWSKEVNPRILRR